jgi:Lamin Tail Domain
MRIKRLATFLVAGGVFSLPLPGVGPASAASVPVVYIHEIQYSPAGPDVPVTTAKLDGEWVLLTNTTGKSVSMTNWTLRDKAGHVYRFPSFVLKAHQSVEVHTGAGRNSATNLYWGHKPPSSTSYVWNNSGTETATLRNASGRTIDSRSYTGRSVCGVAQVFYKP